MSVLDSLLVALLVMGIVFIVLIVLSFLVKIQSIIFNFIDRKKDKPSNKDSTQNCSNCNSNHVKNIQNVQNVPEVSIGQLDLIGVDERTAAMIMAIVSDELKVSLNELQFRSIKALD